MTILVRDSRPSDAAEILRLGAAVDEFTVSDDTVVFWPPEILARAIDAPDVLVLVAEDAGLVGFVIAAYNAALSKAVVENIYVRPDHRGLDVGGHLLGALVDRLADRGCQYVAALVPPGSAQAVALYQRHGFAIGRTFVWLDRSLTDTFVSTTHATAGR